MYPAGAGRRRSRRFAGCRLGVNMGKMVEFVLHDGVDPATGKLMGLKTGDRGISKNIEEFKDALKKQIIYHYDMIRTGYNLMQSIHMNRFPVIFASMVTKGCVESGKSVQHGGALYSTDGLLCDRSSEPC